MLSSSGPRLAVACLGVTVVSCAPSGAARRQASIGNVTHATFMHAGFAAGPALFTDESGHVLEERRYEPFGVPLGTPDLVARDLNPLGRRTDAATGWSDHGARWMAPEAARWLTPDPMIEAPIAALMDQPWGLHPYQFVDQNPVAFWDPDGRWPRGLDPVQDKAALQGMLRQCVADHDGPAGDAVAALLDNHDPLTRRAYLNTAEHVLDGDLVVRETTELRGYEAHETWATGYDPATYDPGHPRANLGKEITVFIGDDGKARSTTDGKTLYLSLDLTPGQGLEKLTRDIVKGDHDRLIGRTRADTGNLELRLRQEVDSLMVAAGKDDHGSIYDNPEFADLGLQTKVEMLADYHPMSFGHKDNSDAQYDP